MPKTAPCKGCHDRAVGCHGKCEKYAAWQVEHAKAWKYHFRELLKSGLMDTEE